MTALLHLSKEKLILRQLTKGKDKGTVLCPDFQLIIQLPSTREGKVAD